MLLALYSLWDDQNLPSAPAIIPPRIPAPVYAPSADSDDILNRLIRLLPSRWWSTPAPIRDAILGGSSDILSQGKALFVYAKAQMRLATATGFWIDLFSYDYLGLTTQRRTAEVDAAYAARVKKELVRERVTRLGMYQALLDLTGTPPVIFEPFLGSNAGGWDISWWGWDIGNGSSAPASLNGNAIGWGDSADNQVFVTIFQSGVGLGVAFSGGWDTGYAGWDQCSQWVDDSSVAGAVTQQDILDTINRTKPIGVTVWVRII